MKRFTPSLLAALLVCLLVVNPALAGRGNGGDSGKGNSHKSSTAQDTVGNKDQDKSQASDKNTKEQKAQEIKARLNVLKAAAEEKDFNDTNDHWAKHSVERLQSLGLISGYEDGSFKPDAPVTAVEAMVLAVNLSEVIAPETDGEETDPDIDSEDNDLDEETTDEDVDEDIDEDIDEEDGEEDDGQVPGWAEKKAQQAELKGIINMNRFHSEVQASRAQAAVMLAKAMELEPVDTSEFTFSDSILISAEDLGYIMALREAGVVFGSPDGKFNPNSSITRAEIAAMMDRILENAEEEAGDEEATDPGAEDETGDEDPGTSEDEDTSTTDSTPPEEEGDEDPSLTE